ncbi:MAG: hypothetical protein WCL14_07590 [Bacteroidota bacterium]
MGLLKNVLVKIGIFIIMRRASVLKQYVEDCVSTGSAATLFKDPHITTVFYTSLTNAAIAIQTAIDICTLAPTKGNKKAIKDAMAAAKLLLVSYANQVVVIANLPINAPTREVAATNIAQSHLTPQKLSSSKKGNPAKPKFTAKNIGTGTVEVEITNGSDYQPTSITIVAVEQAKVAEPIVQDPIVSLIRGQLVVQSAVAAQVVTLSFDGKGRFGNFDCLKSGVTYKIYAYAKNGKKQISLLSDGVLVNG